MPLTAKGEEIKASMKKEYGAEKGEEVFYASKNAGTISGVDADLPPDATKARDKALECERMANRAKSRAKRVAFQEAADFWESAAANYATSQKAKAVVQEIRAERAESAAMQMKDDLTIDDACAIMDEITEAEHRRITKRVGLPALDEACAKMDALRADAKGDWEVEYRENNRAKVAQFENRQRALDFFNSCKSDPSCSDIALFSPRTGLVLRSDAVSGTWEVEYREGNKAKVSRFENRQRAEAFFNTCKGDESCSDIILYSPSDREVMRADVIDAGEYTYEAWRVANGWAVRRKPDNEQMVVEGASSERDAITKAKAKWGK